MASNIEVEIDARHDDIGFAYVGNTRILYAARYLVDHTRKPATPDEIVLTDGSGGWPIASWTERRAAFEALSKAFSPRIVVDGCIRR